MKYLIISDAASMHVYNFIRFFLADSGYDITVLRHSVQKIPEQYQQFYDEHNIKIFTPSKPIDRKGPVITVKRFFRKLAFLKKYGKADVCHIHYAHSVSCLLYLLFRRNFKHLIVTFWGTDILNPPKRERFIQQKVMPFADRITVTVKNSEQVFRNRFGNGYDDRLKVVHFPSGGVPKIKEMSEKYTKAECRAQFNVPDGKLLAVCGYNSDPDQRQDICLEEIAKLTDAEKKKLHLIIPMQYGKKDEAYTARVKDAAAKCGCSYEILEQYVPFERNAVMCLATDIYINVRVSDAFSNAMKEQITAGSYMIQGDWMKYIEVDEMHAPVKKISDLSELHTALEEVLSTVEFDDENRIYMPMYEIFAPDSLKREWQAIFDSVLQDD